MTTVLSPSRRLPARHRVREEIEAMIMAGQRSPGSKLPQQHLARQFGVAPLVVREALLELSSLGLVKTINNRGAFVADLNKEVLLASYDVREAIEGMTARLCCPRVTRLEIQSLRELVERMYTAAQAGHWEDGGRLDRELHARLINLSGNPLLARLSDHYHWVTKIVTAVHDPQLTRKEHLDILQAIEDCRPDDAERLMRAHIRNGKAVVEKQLADGTFNLHWLE